MLVQESKDYKHLSPRQTSPTKRRGRPSFANSPKAVFRIRKAVMDMVTSEFENWLRVKLLGQGRNSGYISKRVRALNAYVSFLKLSSSKRVGGHLEFVVIKKNQPAFREYLAGTLVCSSKESLKLSINEIVSHLNDVAKLYSQNESVDALLLTGNFGDVVAFAIKQKNLSFRKVASHLGIAVSAVCDWMHVDLQERSLPNPKAEYLGSLEDLLGFKQGELRDLLPSRFDYTTPKKNAIKLKASKGLKSSFDLQYKWRLEHMRVDNPMLADFLDAYIEFKCLPADDLHLPWTKKLDPATGRIVSVPLHQAPLDSFGELRRMYRNTAWTKSLNTGQFEGAEIWISRIESYFGFLVHPMTEENPDLGGLGLEKSRVNIMMLFNEVYVSLYGRFLSARRLAMSGVSGNTQTFTNFLHIQTELLFETGFLRQRMDLISPEHLPTVEDSHGSRRPVDKLEWLEYCTKKRNSFKEKESATSLVKGRDAAKKLSRIIDSGEGADLYAKILAGMNDDLEKYRKNRINNKWVAQLLRDRPLLAFQATFVFRASTLASIRIGDDLTFFGPNSDFVKDPSTGETLIFLEKERFKNRIAKHLADGYERELNLMFPVEQYISEYLAYARQSYFMPDDDELKPFIFRFSSRSGKGNRRGRYKFQMDLYRIIAGVSYHYVGLGVALSIHDFRHITGRYLRDKFGSDYAAAALCDTNEVATLYGRNVSKEARQKLRATLPATANRRPDPDLEAVPSKLKKLGATATETSKSTPPVEVQVDSIDKARGFIAKYRAHLMEMQPGDIQFDAELDGLNEKEISRVLEYVARQRKLAKLA